MSTGDTRLEIGHVLFIDIVGYSKLLLKQQSELLSELNGKILQQLAAAAPTYGASIVTRL